MNLRKKKDPYAAYDIKDDSTFVYAPSGKRVSSTSVTLLPDGREIVQVNFEDVPTVDPVVLAFQKVNRA